MHLLERMRQEGAIVIIKLDGERTSKNDNGPYSFVVTSGPLGNGSIRIDSESIDVGLAYIISEYNKRVWRLLQN